MSSSYFTPGSCLCLQRHSSHSIVKLLIPLQSLILTLSTLKPIPQIHASEPPHFIVTLLKNKILRLVNLNLLINMHSTIFSMNVRQSRNSHSVLHALLNRCRVWRVEDEVETIVWVAVEGKCRMSGGKV